MTSLESFINFCDELFIAEESMQISDNYFSQFDTFFNKKFKSVFDLMDVYYKVSQKNRTKIHGLLEKDFRKLTNKATPAKMPKTSDNDELMLIAEKDINTFINKCISTPSFKKYFSLFIPFINFQVTPSTSVEYTSMFSNVVDITYLSDVEEAKNEWNAAMTTYLQNNYSNHEYLDNLLSMAPKMNQFDTLWWTTLLNEAIESYFYKRKYDEWFDDFAVFEIDDEKLSPKPLIFGTGLKE